MVYSFFFLILCHFGKYFAILDLSDNTDATYKSSD